MGSLPLNFRPMSMNALSPTDSPRFQLFIINSGWHSAASEVIEENMANFKAMMEPHPVYVLSVEQSRRVLLSDPDRVGTDPCLLLVDQHAKGGKGDSGYHGFRLSLGRTTTKAQALQLLQTFTRFIVANQDAKDIEARVRSRLKKEGLQNVFEVLKTVV